MRLTASVLPFTRERARVLSATRRTDTPCRDLSHTASFPSPGRRLERAKTAAPNSPSRSRGVRSGASCPRG